MKRSLSILCASLALSASLARASDINWADVAFDGDPQNGTGMAMYNSHGGLLDNSFSFELGTWNTGFTPTAANVDSWAANWKVICTADQANGHWLSLDSTDPSVNDPSSNAQFFTNVASFNADGTVVGGSSSIFHTNEQAYIWVFNTKGMALGTEWALVTDNSLGTTADDIWRLPDPAASMSMPLTWQLNTADTAVVGQVNGTVGAGAQSFDPGANRLQTFDVNSLSVVPEPGSAVLILLAGMAVRLRRRQRLP